MFYIFDSVRGLSVLPINDRRGIFFSISVVTIQRLSIKSSWDNLSLYFNFSIFSCEKTHWYIYVLPNVEVTFKPKVWTWDISQVHQFPKIVKLLNSFWKKPYIALKVTEIYLRFRIMTLNLGCHFYFTLQKIASVGTILLFEHKIYGMYFNYHLYVCMCKCVSPIILKRYFP